MVYKLSTVLKSSLQVYHGQIFLKSAIIITEVPENQAKAHPIRQRASSSVIYLN